ncbi:hypothetical protein [Methanoregula sp.]|uniref:hypothetical protein n=1 Tax=Methanoregula sp. TaxID=2052170 RepID=UPI00262D2EDF|nr:hypothetical protein [Methanoregula sp.]MDD5142173.1 hypothetical protein [Methanoregula sp.]
MRRGDQNKQYPGETDGGVATLIEYILISGVLTGLFVVVLLLTNTHFMEMPARTITYSAYTDISNGVSTRIVDIYSIAPVNGDITSKFDIPDEVAGRGYLVEVGNLYDEDLSAQTVRISGNSVTANVAIAGIGSTRRAGGNTTGSGMNRISYNSGGFV